MATMGIMINALGDIILSLGVAQNLLESTAFKDYESNDKALLVSTFTSSYMLHGCVRLIGAYRLSDPYFRALVVLSYLCEIYVGALLALHRAIDGPLMYLVLLAPLVPIVLLTIGYKDNNNNTGKKSLVDEEDKSVALN